VAPPLSLECFLEPEKITPAVSTTLARSWASFKAASAANEVAVTINEFAAFANAAATDANAAAASANAASKEAFDEHEEAELVAALAAYDAAVAADPKCKRLP